MPRQPVHATGRRLRGQNRVDVGLWLTRAILAIGTISLSAFGIGEMYLVLSTGRTSWPQWIFLALFAVNFSWISFAFCQAALGCARLVWRGLTPRRRRFSNGEGLRTAVLVPIYNEDPKSVAAALRTLSDGLARQAPGQFAVFVLSDSSQPETWIEEEAALFDANQAADSACPIYYRHRPTNEDRKAGNLADWVRRWGGGYEAMLVADADSLMSPRVVIEMSRRLAADPALGLIQSLPSIIRGKSLCARLQQFANRCYGPLFGEGLAAWHGRSSNFWGHNAIIRTRAFAEAAGLPQLSGKPPFGGLVLSHDFIEAALLRRAGWGVRLDTDLTHSYEDAPPTLVDMIIRDQRWCQGNLQHIRFLFAKGLSFASRLHLLIGIMAYMSALFWLMLVVVGIGIAAQVAFIDPDYFPENSLFPVLPIFDSARAIDLFILSMAILFAPKFFAWFAALCDRRRTRGFGGPPALTASILVESAISTLQSPIIMLAQSRNVFNVLIGRDVGWQPQRRSDGSIGFGEAWRMHSLHVAVGVALTALSLQLSLYLFFWLLPLTLGLTLAPLVSWCSASRGLGSALRKASLLVTPEELSPPPVLRHYEANLQAIGSPRVKPLLRLMSQPSLFDWHLGQISPAAELTPELDAALWSARAKSTADVTVEELADWLTDEETMALLRDANLLRGLRQEHMSTDVAVQNVGRFRRS